MNVKDLALLNKQMSMLNYFIDTLKGLWGVNFLFVLIKIIN